MEDHVERHVLAKLAEEISVRRMPLPVILRPVLHERDVRVNARDNSVAPGEEARDVSVQREVALARTDARDAAIRGRRLVQVRETPGTAEEISKSVLLDACRTLEAFETFALFKCSTGYHRESGEKRDAREDRCTEGEFRTHKKKGRRVCRVMKDTDPFPYRQDLARSRDLCSVLL